MWGKHDETRSMLKSAIEALKAYPEASYKQLEGMIQNTFQPAIKSIEEMIYKEENILFPMCLDTFTDIDWYEIYKQSHDIGFCLIYPETEWKPEFSGDDKTDVTEEGRVKLSSGSFKPKELESMLNSLPIDFTFVDKDDKVRYFSQGKDRVFARTKAILGRQVQYCHPPSSVGVVNRILEDFKSGAQDEATFWIDFHGKFVHIAYYAVRDEERNYLGTVEVTQDIKEFRELKGERRILQYDS
jgi:hypothetical protein